MYHLPVHGALGIGAEHPQTTNEHRHLGRAQRQQLRAIDEHLFSRHTVGLLLVVAEAIGLRFLVEKGLIDLDEPLSVHAAGREGHRHVMTSILGGFLNSGATAEYDQIGKRDLLTGRIEFLLDVLQ